MVKFHCLTSKYNKLVLLKDFGDTTKLVILHLTCRDAFVKVDGRVKSKDDFIKLYGFEAKHTEEEMDKALVWKQK